MPDTWPSTAKQQRMCKRGERSTVVVCGCKGYEGPVPYTEYSPEEKI